MERVLNSPFLSALVRKLEGREGEGEAQLDPRLSPLSLPLTIRPQMRFPGPSGKVGKDPPLDLGKSRDKMRYPIDLEMKNDSNSQSFAFFLFVFVLVADRGKE